LRSASIVPNWISKVTENIPNMAPRQKVSRDGLTLIKSFEGFHPRAIKRHDGRWTIGYGHTRSAREGATVTEAEADLLLRYDLIPLIGAIEDVTADHPLNQRQFDAVASFAVSVGEQRFRISSVARCLKAGQIEAAAAALAAWPETTPPRRRAVEQALFVSDPARPTGLVELMAAPVPDIDPSIAPFPVALPQPATEPEETPLPAAVAASVDAHDAGADAFPLAGTASAPQETPASVEAAEAEAAVSDIEGLRSVLRHEPPAPAPASLGARLPGLFVGALGLISAGAAVAAFRRAAAEATGATGASQTTAVGIVLVVIAIALIVAAIWTLRPKPPQVQPEEA
jgi:lysozyme